MEGSIGLGIMLLLIALGGYFAWRSGRRFERERRRE